MRGGDQLKTSRSTGDGDQLETSEMTCISCGGQMHTQRENFLYEACGLPGVTLMDVEVSRCPQCGAYEVAIPQIDDLHKAIAQALIRKTSRLDAAEIRYLRKYLGWSGADFAAHIGATRETVSRWESGATPIGPASDRLLRLMVVTRDPINDYPLERLATISKELPETIVRWGVTRDEEGWHAFAA
jgi:putative zinc finger/helix-turn-helix YgiT family protein